MADIVIGTLIIVSLCLAVRTALKKRKKDGCCGNCSKCSGCR